MQIDGTGEIPRPAAPTALDSIDDPSEAANGDPNGDPPEPWQPEFDDDDDLDGLLQVSSPLLARAFRGTDRPKR